MYPQNKKPTFINMSQEHVDMRDSYLGETRLRLWAGQETGCLGRTGARGWGMRGQGWGSLGAEPWPLQVTPQSWPFGRGNRT